MPEIGEIKKGWETNLFKDSHSYQWLACEMCGKERWVTLRKGRPRYKLCHPCILPRGKGNPNWKGGRVIDSGYAKVKLPPDDFFYPMANKNGYVSEHRLVVARALGRNLQSWEIVHHKHNKYPAGSIEDKQDNRYPENLQLELANGHTQITIMEKIIARQRKQITELKMENRLLHKPHKN